MPSALIIGLNGLVVIFVVASQIWVQVINRRMMAEDVAQELAALEDIGDDDDDVLTSSDVDVAQAV